MKWRIIYGVLCVLALITYSLPWSKMSDKIYTGWQFLLPFSFTYFIGLLLAFVVLFTRYRAVGLTITAGILLFLGVLGGIMGAGIFGGLSQAVGHSGAQTGSGLALSFLMSIVYTILGAIAGNKFKKAHVVVDVK